MIRRWTPFVVIVALVLCERGTATQRSESGPLSLVLVIDVSASVDFRTLELPRDVSGIVDSALLARLRADDRFGVAAFGATTKFSGFLSGDRAGRLAAVKASLRDRSVGLNGPSRIWDAVDETIASLDGQPLQRAVILMTDGRANGNRVGLDAVITRATASAVRVSVIASGSVESQVRARYPELEPHLHLQRLVAETGGTFAADEVGDHFRQRQPGHHFETILRQLGR